MRSLRIGDAELIKRSGSPSSSRTWAAAVSLTRSTGRRCGIELESLARAARCARYPLGHPWPPQTARSAIRGRSPPDLTSVKSCTPTWCSRWLAVTDIYSKIKCSIKVQRRH